MFPSPDRFLVSLLLGWIGLALPHGATAAPSPAYDVVVYGATPAGIMAAITASQCGQSVALVELEDHVGGIVSNGLTNADLGKKLAVGGLYDEFRRRVVKFYEGFDRDNPEQPNIKAARNGYFTEAHVAEQIFQEMLGEQSKLLQLFLRHELRGATVRGGRLEAATFVTPALSDRPAEVTLSAKVFIDATYEGDLAAAAKVPYRVGRESRSEYGEPHAGRIYMRHSELEILPGSTGEGDNTTEGYCFRFHVTKDPAQRVPVERPAGYRREDYAEVLKQVREGKITTFRHVIQLIPMPNGKFELNSDHPHPDTGVPSESLDLAEENWKWPEASYAERRQMYRRYLSHNVGLVWFVQHDEELPEGLRKDSLQYGWCRDEWPENGHLPRQVYVRQGRRIVGDYTLTERDDEVDPALQRAHLHPDAIAIIEWPYDSHGVRKFEPDHPGVREGYTMVPHAPVSVPYGVLVPTKVDGLLVPVACSCSHVAYNSLRMEPVFMALGEVCGLAAHLAIHDGTPLRKVSVPVLQRQFVERRGVINYLEDLPPAHPHFPALQWAGARGFNPGYRATPEAPLTQGEAAVRLGRVLQAENRTSNILRKEGEPMTARLAAEWLQAAGYRVEIPREDSPVTVGTFAALLYRTMAPK